MRQLKFSDVSKPFARLEKNISEQFAGEALGRTVILEDILNRAFNNLVFDLQIANLMSKE